MSQPLLWWRALGGGVAARISSPSLTRGLPSNIPHPHHSQDKGAIEGLRQGRMPRGCRIQIKGKNTQPWLPPWLPWGRWPGSETPGFLVEDSGDLEGQ